MILIGEEAKRPKIACKLKRAVTVRLEKIIFKYCNFCLHMEVSRRGGFAGNFEGKERTITFSLSSGDMDLLHKESNILSVSFLSVTRGLAPAHKARPSPP